MSRAHCRSCGRSAHYLKCPIHNAWTNLPAPSAQKTNQIRTPSTYAQFPLSNRWVHTSWIDVASLPDRLRTSSLALNSSPVPGCRALRCQRSAPTSRSGRVAQGTRRTNHDEATQSASAETAPSWTEPDALVYLFHREVKPQH